MERGKTRWLVWDNHKETKGQTGVVAAYKLWSDWELNPGLLDIYQVLFQLSYLAWEHQSGVGIMWIASLLPL